MSRSDAPARDATSRREVSWAELFFDLVFVYAASRVPDLFQTHPDAAAIAHAAILFVPMYWVWVGVALTANLRGYTKPRPIANLFAIALAMLFMALSSSNAFSSEGIVFGLSFFAARVLLLMGLWRHDVRLPTFVTGVLLTGPTFAVGGLLPAGPRTVLWALAAAVDLLSPLVLRRHLVQVRYQPRHLNERFAALPATALGFAIVNVGSGAPENAPQVLRTLAVVFVFGIIATIAWAYFQVAAIAMRHALEVSTRPVDTLRQVLIYGHLGFMTAIMLFTVGLTNIVQKPRVTLGSTQAIMLTGGVALYLGLFGYTRWHMFRTLAVPRLTTAVVVLALVWPAHYQPALATAGEVFAALLTLNGWESLILRRHGGDVAAWLAKRQTNRLRRNLRASEPRPTVRGHVKVPAGGH